MSFLAVIHSYWQSNTTLNNALSYLKVYTGVVPETLTLPYAVITPIALVTTPTTCASYYATFDFQITIYDADPDNLEAVANTIAGQFDYQSLSGNTISCERNNGPLFRVEEDSPKRVYSVLLEYSLLENRSLPQT